MSNKSDINILLTLLIILSILTFTRTFIYLLFDEQFVNADKYLGLKLDLIMEGVFTIFAILRLYISALVLIKREIKYDLLTTALGFLIFTSILRLYYEYLYFYKPDSKEKYYIDKFQDVDAFALFLSSSYILYYLFLN